MSDTNKPTIVGLGETLWDVFWDGPRLGGAPLNFSCSASELAQSKARVLLISSVGSDDLGRQAVQALHQHAVDTQGLQQNVRPTGQVLVELDPAGVASYRFAENCAWDQLLWDENLQRLATQCDAVCFGTLGQRSECSRATIQKFVAATSETALRILDVNLRSPFYNETLIRDSLQLANVLKLNEDELPILSGLCTEHGQRTAGVSDLKLMQRLADQFQLRCVALTRGPAGAILIQGDAVSDLPGVQVSVADTVGAGDAFTAAMTLGLLAGQDVQQINQQAIQIASYVCSQPGATMCFPKHLCKDW